MGDLLSYLTNLHRLQKRFIVGVIDYFSILFSVLLALLSNQISFAVLDTSLIIYIFIIPFSSILIFYFLGIYDTVLRYLDFSLLTKLFFGLFVSLIFNLILLGLLEIYSVLNPQFIKLDIYGWIMVFLSSQIIVTSSRLIANFLFRKRSEIRVIIYGAGSAGIQLASALKVSTEMQPIAFVDQNPALHNTSVGNLKIFSPAKLKRLIRRKRIDEVLIAIPSASKSNLRTLLSEIEQYSVRVRILPGLAEIAQGKVLVSELKEVDISDLLGRYEVEANQELIDRNIRDKTVLITGAGGSIGSEIARQVSENSPKALIILDSNEFALYEIKNEIDSLQLNISLKTIIGNVTNKKRITDVCQTFAVDTIYHAAAYKHVPLVEENPFEGVFNNILGTKHCLEAAIDSNVGTFVLISTDKAVRPTNIMGATKRFSEMVLQSYSNDINIGNVTRMTMVRFGNVLGSSGSAIPLFQKQIREGGPVTVTDPEVTRYFMSIPEAAELVIQAGALGEGGDVFVLDMGVPVKIVELAKRLINLSGLEVKDHNNQHGDIEIIFTGLRPGEKLYEELLIGDNVSKTEHKQILRAEEDFLSASELEKYLKLLDDAEKVGDVEALRDILKKVVSGFTPEEEIVDVVHLQKIK